MKYVYACITDKCMRTMDEVKKTRKYKKAQEIARILHIDDIVIDICSSWNRNKSNLYEILQGEGNIIVVTDMTSLGKNDEIAAVYQDIIKKNEILVCYFNSGGLLKENEMSTVDLSFDKKDRTVLSSTLDMNGFMSSTQYRQDSSRMVDTRIIEAYWEIEKGGRSQREIVKAIDSSTNTFLRRTREYVGTDGWVERYYTELETSDIATRPTKLGDVSEEAKQLYDFFMEHEDLRPENPDNPPLEYVVGSLAGIYADLYEETVRLQSENTEEAKFKDKKMIVLAYHLYRQVLRHEKYLKRLKYRK